MKRKVATLLVGRKVGTWVVPDPLMSRVLGAARTPQLLEPVAESA
jgi:hypothetical protein